MTLLAPFVAGYVGVLLFDRLTKSKEQIAAEKAKEQAFFDNIIDNKLQPFLLKRALPFTLALTAYALLRIPFPFLPG